MKKSIYVMVAILAVSSLSACTQPPAKDAFYKFLDTYEGMQFCEALSGWEYINGDYLEGAADEFEAAHPENNSSADVAIWKRFTANAEKAQFWLYKLSPVPESPLKEAAVDAMQHQVDLIRMNSDVDIVLSYDIYEGFEARKAALSSYQPKPWTASDVEDACSIAAEATQ